MSAAAIAGAYDDFAQGLAANNRNDGDTAISAFTAALNAGDLSPGLRPAALYGRAVAYLNKGQCEKAVVDADAALAAKANYREAQMVRAGSRVCLAQYDLAIADYSSLLAAAPSHNAFRDRGMLRWRMGDYAGAGADFSAAVRLAPKNGYDAVWLALSQARAGTLDVDGIRRATSQVDDDDWPAPLVSLFLGKSTPDAVLVLAGEGDAAVAANETCEAQFYLAEWRLGRNEAGEGRALLEKAVAGCPHTFVEYHLAKFELKRIGPR
jgi:lipoprotein NlpI